MKKNLLLLFPLVVMFVVSCGKDDSQKAIDKCVKEIWYEEEGKERVLCWSFTYDSEGRVTQAINELSGDIFRYDYYDNVIVKTSITSSFDGCIESYKSNYHLDNEGFLLKITNDDYRFSFFYENGYLSVETCLDLAEDKERAEEYSWKNGNLVPNFYYNHDSGAYLEDFKYSDILNKTSINIGYYISELSSFSPLDGLFFMKFKGTYCKYMESYVKGRGTYGEFSIKWDYKVDQDGFPVEIHMSGYAYDFDEYNNYIRNEVSAKFYIVYE